MDQQTLIFDISSDEEIGLDNSSSSDNFDWISKFLEDDDDAGVPADVSNHQDSIYDAIKNICAGNDDSNVNSNSNNNSDDDDVVVVGEVIAKPRRAKRSFHNGYGGGGGDDDDCVVLEFDPNKPPAKAAVAVANDDEVNCGVDDEDDLVVVGEKGQVACRDFPHSRHLCANFPFSSTPHQSRCNMCHCYVCDSVAPCAYWGSGALTSDHCNATDKGEYWQLERKRFRELKSPSLVTTKHVASLPEFPRLPHPSVQSNLLPRAAASCGSTGVASPFGVPNIISQCRSQRAGLALARNRYQLHLASHQLSRTCNSNNMSNRVVHSSPKMVSSRPVFKRSGYAIRPGVSRSAYSSPNTVNVAYLQPLNQQLAREPVGNSSPRLFIDPSSRQSNMSSISPRTLPLPLQGHRLPSPQTPTSQFQECDQSACGINDTAYMHSSVNQAPNNSTPIVPRNTSSVLNNASQDSPQCSTVTQNISAPILSSLRSDVPTSISQGSHESSVTTQTCFSPLNPCSTSNALNNVAQNSCSLPSVADSIVEGSVPMHELLPSVEQESQTSLNFEFENWLHDGEAEGSFFDMNDQPSVTAPLDPGMLYFDFETSWNGLAHS